MLEKACQFDEAESSETELRLESAVNIQSTRTTAVAADVATVKTDVAELSMAVAEEVDGRINVEYASKCLYYLLVIFVLVIILLKHSILSEMNTDSSSLVSGLRSWPFVSL
jgi:hypothetical protein